MKTFIIFFSLIVLLPLITHQYFSYYYPEGLFGRSREKIEWQRTVTCDRVSCAGCYVSKTVNLVRLFGNDPLEHCTRCCQNKINIKHIKTAGWIWQKIKNKKK